MKKNIKEWFNFFNTDDVTEDAPEYIQEACKLADYKLSKKEVAMISARQKMIDATLAREDYVWDEGLAEGLAQGLSRGKAEGKAEIIKKLLSNDIGIGEISSMTGISKGEIEEVVKLT